MAKNLFSVPIFFIVFRETLEAAIIVSVLLGLAEQIVHNDDLRETIDTSRTLTGTATVGAGDDRSEKSKVDSSHASADDTLTPAEDAVLRRRLVRKLRLQVWAIISTFGSYLYRLGADSMMPRFSWVPALACSLRLRLALRKPEVVHMPIYADFNVSSSARFIAVWFTKASDLWAKSEELWEGEYK